ncbi:MAG TPA: hypothetical protein VGV59_09400 [Pyrinomonadaceae bacterium]|nr:hypothetical protein [Pyrinomonadaceae bacterium]
MSKRDDKQASKKRGAARPIFDTIRKPTAPPGHALSRAKPEERAHPAERKAKHKHPAGEDDERR